MPVDAMTKLAETLDKWGAWAVVAVCMFAIAAMAWQYKKTRDKHDRAITALNEAHRKALAENNDKHHVAATSALRDLSVLVREVTAAITTAAKTIEQQTSEVAAMRRLVEATRKPRTST